MALLEIKSPTPLAINGTAQVGEAMVLLSFKAFNNM